MSDLGNVWITFSLEARITSLKMYIVLIIDLIILELTYI